jgi:hypothetical protein
MFRRSIKRIKKRYHIMMSRLIGRFDQWDWALYRSLEHQFAWEEIENDLTDGAYYEWIDAQVERTIREEE